MNFSFRKDWRTTFHITHYKAGSQWIYQILNRCIRHRVVAPQLGAAHVLQSTVRAGRIYPTVYLTKGEFDTVDKPHDYASFVILRDLRDTTVSGYFSLKHSHNELPGIHACRQELLGKNLDEGLIWMIENWTGLNARISESWAESGEPWIRYEDLLADDITLLENALLVRCRLPIKQSKLRRAILACRFERLSGGRRPGQEDIFSHMRNGMANDWRRYFSPKVKAAFKERYGQTLIACGYEKNNDW
jgi:hypothetical protein